MRKRYKTVEEGGKSSTVEDGEVKNLKSKLIPTNLRFKRTRAIRRALTKAQAKKTNIRVLKKKLKGEKISQEESGISTREWDELVKIFKI